MATARAFVIAIAVSAVNAVFVVLLASRNPIGVVGLLVLLTVVLTVAAVFTAAYTAYRAGFNKGVQHAEHVYRHD